jgi:hypothetical protein
MPSLSTHGPGLILCRISAVSAKLSASAERELRCRLRQSSLLEATQDLPGLFEGTGYPDEGVSISSPKLFALRPRQHVPGLRRGEAAKAGEGKSPTGPSEKEPCANDPWFAEHSSS